MPASGGFSGRSIPFGHGGGSEGPEDFAGDEVTLEIEGVVDRGVGGDEAFGLALRLEALHLSLASPDRKMGVLDPVVVAEANGNVAEKLSDMLVAEYLDRFAQAVYVAELPCTDNEEG